MDKVQEKSVEHKKVQIKDIGESKKSINQITIKKLTWF